MPQNQQEQSEAKLLAFIEGELDAQGRAEIEKHLEAHPQHRQLLEDMRGMRDWVRWLPRETAPAELAESFQGKLERSVLLGPPDKPVGRDPMRINRWPQFRAAAVAALAVGLGLIVYRSLPDRHGRYVALPPATQPYAINVPASGPSETTALSDGSRNRPDARDSERSGTNVLVENPANDPNRLPAPQLPATHPIESEIAASKDTSSNDFRRLGARDETTARLQVSAPAVPATEPVVADLTTNVAEPTEELERVARGTYQMVSADPAIINLLDHASPVGGGGAIPGGDQAKLRDQPVEKSLPARNQYVMVVLSSDTDRARKQIGDFLANNGIRTQMVKDADNPAPSDAPPAPAPPALEKRAMPALRPTSMAAGVTPAQAAAPATRRSFPMAPAAPAAAPPPMAALEHTGEAAPSAPSLEAGHAAPGSVRSAVPPAPVSAADGLNKKEESAPAGAASPAVSASPALARITGSGEKGASPENKNNEGLVSLSQANGDFIIARRMTARQARDLQANLRRPQASQWAEVYSELVRPTSPAEQLGDRQSAEALPNTRQQTQAGREGAFPQGQFKDAAGEASAARKIAGKSLGKANELATTAPLAAPSAGSGKATPARPAPNGGGAPMTPAAAAPFGEFTGAPEPAAAVPTAATGGAGGVPVQVGQPPHPEQLDRQLTTGPAPFNAPASQPNEPRQMFEMAPTTAPAGLTAEDQPVDIVIVVQQSSAPPVPAPQGAPATPSVPAVSATRPGG